MTAKIKIRPSMRASWRKCPRSFFYRWVAGVEPQRTGRALIVGGSFHFGLEQWRSGMAPFDAAKAAKLHFEELWAGSYPTEPPDPVTIVQVMAYVQGYARHFAPFDRGVQVVEAPVWDDSAGDGGTSDCVQRNSAGEIWVIEDKTTSRFDGQDAMAFSLKMNDQLATYVFALRRQGIPVVGARYRQTLKTGTSQTKKETLEDYYNRLVAIYTGGDSDTKYREFIVTWTDEELRRLRKTSDSTNRAIRRALPYQFEDYQINPLSCLGAYGPCQYLNLCRWGKDSSTPPQYKPSQEDPLDEGSFRREIWTQADPATSGGPGALDPADIFNPDCGWHDPS